MMVLPHRAAPHPFHRRPDTCNAATGAAEVSGRRWQNPWHSPRTNIGWGGRLRQALMPFVAWTRPTPHTIATTCLAHAIPAQGQCSPACTTLLRALPFNASWQLPIMPPLYCWPATCIGHPILRLPPPYPTTAPGAPRKRGYTLLGNYKRALPHALPLYLYSPQQPHHTMWRTGL